MRWPSLQRRPTAWKIFLTAWIVYGLHFATDIVREHYPAFTLAENGTMRVDPYLGLHPDLFEVEGRGSFINNNPGASLVGSLPYILFRPIVDRLVDGIRERRAGREAPTFNDDRSLRVEFFKRTWERGLDVRFGLAAGIIHALATAPISAAAAVLMYLLLLRLGFADRSAVWIALLYAFATPIFFRTGFLNHNLLVAHATLASFFLLYEKERAQTNPSGLFFAGVATGFGLLCDYSGVVPLLTLGLYAFVKLLAHEKLAGALQLMVWMVGGACIPVGLLLAYQNWAFGHPIFPAQRYMPATDLSVHGWYGFDLPRFGLMFENLFDVRFGLFTFGPLLILGLAAPFLARREKIELPRAELRLAFGLALGLFVFTSMNQFARLQWNTGFRMLIPLVPLLFVCTASVLVRLPRRLAITLGVVATLHSWCIAMVRSDAITSVVTIVQNGPRVPWLTSMWRAGGHYLPLFDTYGPQAAPVVVVGAAALLMVWGPPQQGGPKAAPQA
jgi:hypothetical protein